MKKSKAETLQKRDKAIQLRAEGRSYQEIAKELGISLSGAHKTIMAGYNNRISENIDLMRYKHQEVLDELKRNLFQKLEQNNYDEKTANVIIKILEREAKLWNLDTKREEANEPIEIIVSYEKRE